MSTSEFTLEWPDNEDYNPDPSVNREFLKHQITDLDYADDPNWQEYDCHTRYVSGIKDPSDPDSAHKMNSALYDMEYTSDKFEKRALDIINTFPIIEPGSDVDQADPELIKKRLFIYFSAAALHSPIQVTDSLLAEVDALRNDQYWTSCSWVDDHSGVNRGPHHTGPVDGQTLESYPIKWQNHNNMNFYSRTYDNTQCSKAQIYHRRQLEAMARSVDNTFKAMKEAMQARSMKDGTGSMWDNSLFLFTSDNGGSLVHQSTNGNLRGGKMLPMEVRSAFKNTRVSLCVSFLACAFAGRSPHARRGGRGLAPLLPARQVGSHSDARVGLARASDSNPRMLSARLPYALPLAPCLYDSQQVPDHRRRRRHPPARLVRRRDRQAGPRPHQLGRPFLHRARPQPRRDAARQHQHGSPGQQGLPRQRPVGVVQLAERHHHRRHGRQAADPHPHRSGRHVPQRHF